MLFSLSTGPAEPTVIVDAFSTSARITWDAVNMAEIYEIVIKGINDRVITFTCMIISLWGPAPQHHQQVAGYEFSVKVRFSKRRF